MKKRTTKRAVKRATKKASRRKSSRRKVAARRKSVFSFWAE